MARCAWLSFFFGFAACSAHTPPSYLDFSSTKATLLDFEFDAELVTDTTTSPEAQALVQLRYTIGQLNGKNSVGRLDATQIRAVVTSPLADGRTLVRYHAVLPVGWSSLAGFPTEFVLKLPRDVSNTGAQEFVRKYGSSCVDGWSAHDVGVGNMWYYYRPDERTCRLDAADLVVTRAAVTVSSENTRGKYPEIDRIWADGVLDAVIIFGKDNPSATTMSDFGIASYGRFNSLLPWAPFGVQLSHVPAAMPVAPGVEHPDVTWEGSFPDGRRVRITALLVNNLREANGPFDRRYNELSKRADIVVYNGHAALGDNVRALTRKGSPNPGQYTIVSMMGCDSFAYVDGHMAQQRARLNPDDPKGTRYLDMITNIIPANPTWLPQASLALLAGVIDPTHPQSYAQILDGFEKPHLAVITGEEDNTFVPLGR